MNPGASPAPDAASYREAVVALSRAVENLRQHNATDLGISVTGLTALEVVCETDGLTPSQIAAELGLTAGSVTPLLDHLVRAGYVERTQDPTDRRRSLITAKPGGRHASAWANDRIDARLDAAIGHISPADRKIVADFLSNTTEALRQPPAQADD